MNQRAITVLKYRFHRWRFGSASRESAIALHQLRVPRAALSWAAGVGGPSFCDRCSVAATRNGAVEWHEAPIHPAVRLARGLLVLILALRGILRWLFFLWSLAVVYFIVTGYF